MDGIVDTWKLPSSVASMSTSDPPFRLIDCHAHTYPSQFPHCDLLPLLRRAAAASVSHIVTVPETLADAHEILALARSHPLIFPMEESFQVAHSANQSERVECASEPKDPARQILYLNGLKIAPAIGLHPVQPGPYPPDVDATSAGSEEPSAIQVSHSVQLCELEPVLALIRSHAECSVKGDSENTAKETGGDAASDREVGIVCIGEIGLDFSPNVVGKVKPTDKSNDISSSSSASTSSSTNTSNGTSAWKTEELKAVQREVFRRQLSLAAVMSLPVNVHSRSAGHHAIEEVIQSGLPATSATLMHAFDGRLVHAEKAERHGGFFFSVPPSIVRSPQTQKTVKGLPLSCLVLETDSPALAPEKGAINEPSNIMISCKEIARIHGVSVTEVARITTDNAMRLFPRLKR